MMYLSNTLHQINLNLKEAYENLPEAQKRQFPASIAMYLNAYPNVKNNEACRFSKKIYRNYTALDKTILFQCLTEYGNQYQEALQQHERKFYAIFSQQTVPKFDDYLGNDIDSLVNSASKLNTIFFTKSVKNKATSKVIWHIVRGEEKQARQILNGNPHLLEILTTRRNVKDYSGRVFKNVLPLEIIYWTRDRFMAQMLYDCIPRNDTGEEIRQILLEQYYALSESGHNMIKIQYDPSAFEFTKTFNLTKDKNAVLYHENDIFFLDKSKQTLTLITGTSSEQNEALDILKNNFLNMTCTSKYSNEEEARLIYKATGYQLHRHPSCDYNKYDLVPFIESLEALLNDNQEYNSEPLNEKWRQFCQLQGKLPTNFAQHFLSQRSPYQNTYDFQRTLKLSNYNSHNSREWFETNFNNGQANYWVHSSDYNSLITQKTYYIKHGFFLGRSQINHEILKKDIQFFRKLDKDNTKYFNKFEQLLEEPIRNYQCTIS